MHVTARILATSVLSAVLSIVSPALPFAAAPPAEVPQTGQTICYNSSGYPFSCAGTGQDGEQRTGAGWPYLRFVDNSLAGCEGNDQTITDTLTGLTWTKNFAIGGTTTWSAALSFVKQLNSQNYLGHNDWRLPNVNELNSLLTKKVNLNDKWLASNGFTNVQSGYYWTSTTYTAGTPAERWYAVIVDMITGIVASDAKTGIYYYAAAVRGGTDGVVRLPRTGQTDCFSDLGALIDCSGTGQDGELQAGIASPQPRFQENSDGTVTDSLTGLDWSKNSNPASGYYSWEAALGAVATLNSQNYLGHNDWRLPNVNELASLVNRVNGSPASWLGSQGFQYVEGNYWTSTSFANTSGSINKVWYVAFDYGRVDWGGKSGYPQPHVWPVRGGVYGPFQLTVIPTGTGAGSVGSSPAGISCGSQCSALFPAGNQVTLTATPDPGSTFYGWSGACSGTGTCTVAMEAVHEVRAEFKAVPRQPAQLVTWGASGMFSSGYISALAAAPSDSHVLYAGISNGGGIFKSTDSGASWQPMNAGLGNLQVRAIAMDPSQSQTLYAGTWGGGIFKSSDGGTTWSGASTGMTNKYVYSLAVAPGSPQTIYAGTSFGGVFKSINGGGVWSAVNTGLNLTDARDVEALVVDPVSAETVYAGTAAGVYKSSSGGACWKAANNGVTRTSTYYLVMDPFDNRTLYVGTRGGGIFKSIDAGTSWVASNNWLSNTDVISLSADTTIPGVIYAGTNGAGVFRSLDGGESWSAEAAGLTNLFPTSMVTGGDGLQTVFAGTYGGGVFKTGTGLLSITVNVQGTGTGSVHGSSATAIGIPGDISCLSGACRAIYPGGSSITLNATASADSTFEGWLSVCGANPCHFVLDGNKSIGAVFAKALLAKNLSTGIGYPTFKEALNGANRAVRETILLIGRRYDEGAVSLARGVALEGGWSAGFGQTTDQPSSLSGDFQLLGGDTVMERIAVEGCLTVRGGSLRTKQVTVR